MQRIVRAVVALAAGVHLSTAAPTVSAQGYPSKPISFIIGFAPGGPSDVMSRILTGKMELLLGQPFIIENRAGAAGNIAAQAVARATPDGHTLLLATNGILAGNQFIYKNIGYDPDKDFELISIVGLQPNVLFVPAPRRPGRSRSSSRWPRRTRPRSTSVQAALVRRATSPESC